MPRGSWSKIFCCAIDVQEALARAAGRQPAGETQEAPSTAGPAEPRAHDGDGSKVCTKWPCPKIVKMCWPWLCGPAAPIAEGLFAAIEAPLWVVDRTGLH